MKKWRFASLAGSFALAAALPIGLRAQPAPAPAVLVDTATAARLAWWTLAALDQANQTGNYSVLRDLGVPAFQANNSAATLAATFQSLRDQRVDLGLVLNAVPTFERPPAIQGGVLRARGVFALRPTAIGFDLLFQNIGGRWSLFGISVVPLVPSQQRGSTKP